MSFLRFRPVALLITMVVAALLVSAPNPSGAETPNDVLAGLVAGVYVAPGRDADPVALQAVVEDARVSGVRLVIVVAVEPLPSVEAFAKRARQAADVDAALVFGPDGEVAASVIDELSDGFARAESAAQEAGADPGAASRAFLTELQTEPPGGLPDVVSEVVRAAVVLVVIIGLATAGEIALRSRRTKRVTA